MRAIHHTGIGACLLLIATLIAPSAWAASRAKPEHGLKAYRTKHYTVHTNLARKDAVSYGLHMDRVFRQYEQRFARTGMRKKDKGEMPLYLFRTQLDYRRFMAQYGIDVGNSGGIFFVLPSAGAQGLATYVQGRPMTDTLTVLQHEGFHQFAYRYIGRDLPVWVNEGLAQYFEDGIIVKKKMSLGLANARRVESMKTAIADDQTLPVRELLTISEEQWSQTLRADPAKASRLYDQSWSIVYFLVTASERYRMAFERYLSSVSNGIPSERAFQDAFGLNDRTAPELDRAWRRWAMKLEPDRLTEARERLKFLGQALLFLRRESIEIPSTTQELQAVLQRINFRLTQTPMHGPSVTHTAQEPELFSYTLPSGETRMFRMLAPGNNQLLPRLTAPGMSPEPTLLWSHDENRELVAEVVFR